MFHVVVGYTGIPVGKLYTAVVKQNVMLAGAGLTAWGVRDGWCILAAYRCDMEVKER